MAVTLLTSQRPLNHTLVQDVEEVFAEWFVRYFDGTHTYGVNGLDGGAVDDRAIPQVELLIGQDRPTNTTGLSVVHLIFDDTFNQVDCYRDKGIRAMKVVRWTLNILVHSPIQGGVGSVSPRWDARWLASVIRDLLGQIGDPKEELIYAGIDRLRVTAIREIPTTDYHTWQVLAGFQTHTN